MKPGRYLGRARTLEKPASSGPAARAEAAGRPQAAPLRFQTGDAVQHRVFGAGVVIQSKLVGDDEQVTVAFAGAGLKRLMASMAPLEKVEDGG